MTRPSDLVVVLARRETLAWLSDVLVDWSALRMIAPVCLVDVDAVRVDDLRVPASVVAGGRTTATVLQNELARRSGVNLIRLVAFADVGTTAVTPTFEEARNVVEAIGGSLPMATVLRLRVVGLGLTGAGETGLTADLAWLGWHNLVIAPENAPTPASAIVPVLAQPNDPTLQVHLAATLCSLSALWSSVPTGPLDGREVPPENPFFAARSYSRQLTAETIESQLLARLARVEPSFPVPVFQGANTLVLGDEVAAAGQMADQLFAAHPYVLARPRTMPADPGQKPIKGLEALKMLFSFLWSTLRNAPRAFVDAAVRGVSRGIAHGVQLAVFGSTADNEYQVVVNGQTAGGGRASWATIDETLAALSQRVAPGSEGRQTHLDLSTFWKDFVGGGMTLLDAEPRSAGLPPRMEGSQRAVISSGRRVAPDPADVFEPPESIEAYLNEEIVIAPHDVLGSRDLEARMVALAGEQAHLATPVGAVRNDLYAWGREQESSYTGRVGLRLGREISSVRQELQGIDARLRTAEGAAQVPSEIEAQQKALAKKIRLYFLLALGGLVLSIVAGALGWISWVIAAVLVVVIAFGWLWGSSITFMHGQREFFRMLYERKRAAEELQALRQHLVEAVEDLRRLSRAYRQYGDWTAALGRFLRSPYGRPESREDSSMLLGSRFPENHRFGAARPNGDVLDEVASRLKQDMFGVGWLGEAWQLFLADVPREMGAEAFKVEESKDLLFADPEIARSSLLSSWSEVVAHREGWNGTASALQAKAADALTRTPELKPRLLAEVETRRVDGVVERVRYEDFLSGLGQAANAHEAFSRQLLGSALPGEVLRVDPEKTSVTTSPRGLGATVVVTQISTAFQLPASGYGAPVVPPFGTPGTPGADESLM